MARERQLVWVDRWAWLTSAAIYGIATAQHIWGVGDAPLGDGAFVLLNIGAAGYAAMQAYRMWWLSVAQGSESPARGTTLILANMLVGYVGIYGAALVRPEILRAVSRSYFRVMFLAVLLVLISWQTVLLVMMEDSDRGTDDRGVDT